MIKNIIDKLNLNNIQFFSTGGVDVGSVKRLKEILEIEELPQDYEDFLLNYGAISFEATDVNGVLKNVDILEPTNYNVVGLSKEAIQNYNLPKRVLILGDAGLGEQYALVCDKQVSGFGKIFYWNPAITNLDNIKVVYNSFSEFLDNRVMRCID